MIPISNTTQTDSIQEPQPVIALEEQPQVDDKHKKINKQLLEETEICKSYRKKLISNWSLSVDYRRGKPLASQSDDDQVVVNLDWSLTKTKQASLFSQVPQVRVSHPPQSISAGPWLTAYEGKLNDTLVTAGIEAAMDECLPDCINAAGFGAVLVYYEAITQDKDMPSVDLSLLPPETHSQVLQSGMLNGVKVPMEAVPQVLDRRYCIQRLSPSDLLWPIEFTGSNFDVAPWIGRSGRVSWAEAVLRFGLKEEDREKYMGSEDRTTLDRLTYDVDKDKSYTDKRVGFDEIFYKVCKFDPQAQSFSTIHHLVFIHGNKEPVIDEPWKGQKVGEDGIVIGSIKSPIRVLTLSYITDETIPPSDSAIGRPQVNEINAIRTLEIQHRKRNIPFRWVDINRTDPTILQSLMRGAPFNVVPVQGDGSRILGEVAKQTAPPENFQYDQIIKNDINETWSLGPNQLGSGANVETKGESAEIASHFQTRIGRERAKVTSFVVSIAEVLGGLIALYEDPSAFGEGFDPKFSRSLCYSILADSTVLLDSNQRLKRLNDFVNTYAKSGWVMLEPVLKEIAQLSGLDPNTVIKAPQPKPPVEPNISLRLSGTEDMLNPLTLAFLIKSGQAPPPELIEQAKQLIQQAVAVPSQAPMNPDGTPQSAPLAPPGSSVPVPEPAPPKVGDANPEMTILPTVNKRAVEGSNPQ